MYILISGEKKMINHIGIDLRGKVAAVTNAGGAVGGLLSVALAAAGARVVMLDSDKNAALGYTTHILDTGGVAKAYCCSDLSREECTIAARLSHSDFGECSIIVNVMTRYEQYHKARDMEEMLLAPEKLCEQYHSMLYPIYAFAPQMKSGASIINILPYGREDIFERATAELAVLLSEKGIRVNSIASNLVSTYENRHLLYPDEGGLLLKAQSVIQKTPMGRLSQPEDIEGAVLFLASAKTSAFMTGETLRIDGGMRAGCAL